MVFSSVHFLFYFFPASLFFYYLIPAYHTRARNFCLLLMSLLFYSWGEGPLVFLLLSSIGVNYAFGLSLNFPDFTRYRKRLLALGIVLNLLLLAVAKYAGFIQDLLNQAAGMELNFKLFDSLPLGISFFTFQAISYLVDIYRGEVEPETEFINVGLYISMYTQLVAGPIVRYGLINDQIRVRVHSWVKFASGITWFIAGLAYKIIIADTVALSADKIFAINQVNLSASIAWLGALAYTFQIYFDFAGYSLMAIGLGRMFGFELPRNFNYPYISTSITDFWRRWHMTLANWFRDYLYIPMGGNRKGSVATYRNLLIVFFLCGLWHGAAWNFIAWGLYHGFFLVIERILLRRKGPIAIPTVVSWGYAMCVVVIGWVLFRSETLADAIGYLHVMFGGNSSLASPYSLNEFMQFDVMLGFAAGMIILAPWWQRLSFLRLLPAWLLTTTEGNVERPVFQAAAQFIYFMGCWLLLFLVSIKMIAGTYSPFIYFRF